MTNEEVIRILEMHKNSVLCEADCSSELSCYDCDEAFGLAIETLEKQIPKKPNKTVGGKSYCPTCATATEIRIVMSWEKYCPDCGQAIDWEMSND